MLAGNRQPGPPTAKLLRAAFGGRGKSSLRGNNSRDRVSRRKNDGEGMIDHFELRRFREAMERMRLWQVALGDDRQARQSECQQQYRDPPGEDARGAILKHGLTYSPPPRRSLKLAELRSLLPAAPEPGSRVLLIVRPEYR
jgi:hypothetical protein